MTNKEENRVDPTKYVVLDVETNGLSSVRDDLLSISIYKPDTGVMYNRFLPLELNNEVVTTQYNGIITSDLKKCKPLTQNEVDELIDKFDLKNRIVLTYGRLDENFMAKYFQRHNLAGIDYFAFYNFKHEIISSRYSEGNITKDNLCKLYGIDNVHDVHSSSDDCILEWELYNKMNGHRLLITNNKVFEFNNDYVVPVSYISTYPNFKYYLPSVPIIECNSRIVYKLLVNSEKIKKFPTNFNGLIMEHLINSMLNVKKIDSKKQLLENKKTLRYLGKLPSHIDIVPLIFNPDGTMTAMRTQDTTLVKEINTVIDEMKKVFEPMIQFIQRDIFKMKSVYSQELVINKEHKILSLCDLSSDDSVLEIKCTVNKEIQEYANQLYYESNGRKCYILQASWCVSPKGISYIISEVNFNVRDAKSNMELRFENAKKRIEHDSISLVLFKDSKSPVQLSCSSCGNIWKTSYRNAIMRKPCPMCGIKENGTDKKSQKQSRRVYSKEEKQIIKFKSYQSKLDLRSNHKLHAVSYIDSRSLAKARCVVCGYEWSARADHLLDRPYCPLCKKR